MYILGLFFLYLCFSRPHIPCVNDIRHKRERVCCMFKRELVLYFFFSLMATNKPPSLKFGNVYGFYVCRPLNELCFHFIFHRLCVSIYVYMVLRVCAPCALSMLPHKIYNNSLKRFRKQHHTRQSKL